MAFKKGDFVKVTGYLEYSGRIFIVKSMFCPSIYELSPVEIHEGKFYEKVNTIKVFEGNIHLIQKGYLKKMANSAGHQQAEININNN